MQIVEKFIIPPVPVQYHTMPRNASQLAVLPVIIPNSNGYQIGACFAQVDDAQGDANYEFFTVPTGGTVPDGAKTFIGSYAIGEDEWHVWLGSVKNINPAT